MNSTMIGNRFGIYKRRLLFTMMPLNKFRLCVTSSSVSTISEVQSIFFREKNRSRRSKQLLYNIKKCCSTLPTNGHERQVIKESENIKTTKNTNISSQRVNIRQFREKDMTALLQLSNKEGWMSSKNTFDTIVKLDPQSIIVAVDESDRPVGYLAMCDIMVNTYYLIHFVVRDDLRGRNIGRKLNSTMLNRLSDKTGFMDVDYKDVEFQFMKGFIHESLKFNIFHGVVSSKCIGSKKSECDIIHVTKATQWENILDYHCNICKGPSREAMVRAFLSNDYTYTVAAMHRGYVAGYGSMTIYHDDRVSCINMLYADEDNIAEDIFGGMLEDIPNGYVLTFNLIEGKRLPECLGDFDSGSLQQRLYNKNNVEVDADIDRMFCILSF